MQKIVSYTILQFIDLCILLGCDYCDTIRGIGAKRAKDLIDKYHSIEEVIANLDSKKYTVPENWPYQEARRLFKNPEIADPETVDVSNLIIFLISFMIITPRNNITH